MARTSAAGPLLGVLVQYAPALVPGRRLFEDARVLVIRHPRPTYRNHMLLLPKRNARTFVALADRPENWLAAIRAAAVVLAQQGRIDPNVAVLCVNGGPRQDVRQVHFHLFEGPPPSAPGDKLRECLSRIESLSPKAGYTVFLTNPFEADYDLRFVLDADESPR